MTTYTIIKQNQENGNTRVILEGEPNKDDAIKVFNDVKNTDEDCKIKLIVNSKRGTYALKTK